MSRIKEFIVETLLYGFANVFSRFFAMLLIPIFTTYLSKNDFGNFVMLQASFSFLTFFLALNAGVFFYYYEYDNTKYRKIVFSSWFYYQLAVALLIILILVIFSPYLFSLFVIDETNSEVIKWCLIIVGMQLIPYVFNITNINLFRINRKPKKVILIVFFESLLTLSFVYMSFKFFNYGLIGVSIAQVLARLLVALAYYKTISFYINIYYFSKKIIGKIFIYSWPYIVSSIFSIIITSADKFIGASVLVNSEDVAILALATQLVIPIAVLADMIRMALGPYIMSIRKEADAEKTYQNVFELVVFSGSLVIVGVIVIAPLLTLILADSSYLKVVEVVPLLALANVFSLIYVQFAVSFSLVKKTIYIMYAVIFGGVFGIAINYIFMGQYGFVVSGYSQIVSYLSMSIFLYFLGRKVAGLSFQLKNSFVLLTIVVAYIIFTNFTSQRIFENDYLLFIISAVICGIAIVFIYLKQQQLSLPILIKKIINRKG